MKLITSKFNTLLYYISLLITILLFPIIFFFIKLIDVFYKVRFTEILSNRIGHLTVNIEQYLFNKYPDKNDKYIDLFYPSRYGVCNKELFNLWKKKICILPRFLIEPIDIILSKIYGEKNSFTIKNFQNCVTDDKFNRDIYNTPIELSITQINNCKKILLNYGIDIENIKFACFFIRDDAYLKSFRKSKNWYYLTHHNYEIDTFLLTANELTKRGIYVFRMGAKVEKKICTKK